MIRAAAGGHSSMNASPQRATIGEKRENFGENPGGGGGTLGISGWECAAETLATLT